MKTTKQTATVSTLALMLTLFLLLAGCGQDTTDSVSGILAPSENESISFPSGTLSTGTDTVQAEDHGQGEDAPAAPPVKEQFPETLLLFVTPPNATILTAPYFTSPL